MSSRSVRPGRTDGVVVAAGERRNEQQDRQDHPPVHHLILADCRRNANRHQVARRGSLGHRTLLGGRGVDVTVAVGRRGSAERHAERLGCPSSSTVS